MRVDKVDDIKLYQRATFFANLFSKAVKEAKEINRKNGLPNDFVINGKTFYELPNGEITMENPLKDKK